MQNPLFEQLMQRQMSQGGSQPPQGPVSSGSMGPALPKMGPPQGPNGSPMGFGGLSAMMNQAGSAGASAPPPPGLPPGVGSGMGVGAGLAGGQAQGSAMGQGQEMPPSPPLPATPPNPASKLPPQMDRFNNAQQIQDAYRNNWNPNPMLLRAQLGKG